jgi:hypothetical protein
MHTTFRSLTLLFAAASLFFLLPIGIGDVAAQESIPAALKNSCQNELDIHCKKVTPGGGRLIACLYSYGDKLSAECSFAMYDASEQYEATLAALRHIAKRTACRSDIAEYCRGVPPGGGEIYHCIVENKATLTDGCRAALPRAEELMKRIGVVK